ncbi:orotate phosphoribosyltransferase [Candidatus Saccharibacteria bacterium]|nr:orotate phosphoribosyltransferase [Candidatus Saccharibacteria bacterium]
MLDYKKDFIQFLLDNGALKFGNFTLKSGRKSPFFMNIGDLNDGAQLLTLASAYVDAICDHFGPEKMNPDNPPFDVLFGPAYKGIPIAVATAMQLELRYGLTVRYCADRKEAKDHGDVGSFVGAKLKDGDRVLMIEDVTTSGQSMDETIPLIRGYAETNDINVRVVGLVVSFDRMECAPEDERKTALATVGTKYGMRVISIASMEDACEYLAAEDPLPDETVNAINNYYRQYAPVGRREGEMYVK